MTLLANQLSKLRALGINLHPEVTIEDLLDSHSEEEYQHNPYSLLMLVLGNIVDRKPYCQISPNVLHLDIECIDVNGDYVRAFSKLANLTGKNIDEDESWDCLSPSGHIIDFEIVIDGKILSNHAKENNGWLDVAVMMELAQHFEHSGKRIAFACVGKHLIFVFCDEVVRIHLQQLTGMNFQWFSIDEDE